MKSETKDDQIERYSFYYISPEVMGGMALTGVWACGSYGVCNQLSRIMKSNYNKKLPKAVPLFFTATVLVMAGETVYHQHRYNRVFAKIKAIAEENRNLREIE